MTTPRRTIVVLLGLVLVAAALVVWLVRDSGGTPPSVASADSAEATVASGKIKSEVRDAAGTAAARAYSYSWDSVADDKAEARELMTSAMQRRYDRTMAGVVSASRRDHTVVTAEVVDTALVTASTSDARVLVFVNQSTSGDDLDEPLLDLDRVLVTLHRDGGEWKVSELDAL
jgi:hypothetical protein